VLTNEDDVFGDPAVAEAFLSDVAALRLYLPSPGERAIAGRAHGVVASGNGRGRGAVEFESWEQYLDACASQIGQPMLDFAFGLPRPLIDDEAGAQELDDAFTETDDDQDREPTDDGDDGARLPNLRHTSSHKRHRYQRWCQQLAELENRPTPSSASIGIDAAFQTSKTLANKTTTKAVKSHDRMGDSCRSLRRKGSVTIRALTCRRAPSTTTSQLFCAADASVPPVARRTSSSA
jgi:hypothetical protein